VVGGLTYLVGRERPTTPSPTATIERTTPPNSAQQVAPAASELATLTIPAINLTTPVLTGLAPEVLARGVGHLPSSSEPGQLGNSVLEGERTTRSHPFLDLDKLQPGDVVIIETQSGGHFEYTVTDTAVLADYQAARRALPTADGKATLTLYTCTPKYTAKNRLTVYAELDQNASDDPGVADPSPGDDDSEPTGLDC
jgi:sortase A